MALAAMRRERWLPAAALAAAVASAHLLGMRGCADVNGVRGTATPAGAAMEVRSVVLPATPRREPVPPVEKGTVPVPPKRRVASHAPPSVPVVAEPVEAVAEAAPASLPAAATPPEPPPAAAAHEADAAEVPVYPVQLPAAFDRRYRLSRGFLSGEGHFSWSPRAGGAYESRLEGHVAGLNVLDWVSTGAVDAAGVAPERFVVRRRGKDAQAANFQRAAAKISYSGPSVEYPLVPGAQDRLSWMVQLPGVIAAAPERYGPGHRVVLFVSGARGDADVWTFTVAATERLPLPGGERDTLKLEREPRKPYDTGVEIWLDATAGYLPVRARLSSAGGGDALELDWAGD